jgi:hypothetical protein
MISILPTSRVAAVINLATADPSYFTIRNNVLVNTLSPTRPAYVYLVGVVAEHPEHLEIADDKGRCQIQVNFLDGIFPRVASLLAQVFEEDDVTSVPSGSYPHTFRPPHP